MNGTYRFGVTNSRGVSSIFQTYDKVARIPQPPDEEYFPYDLLRVARYRPLLHGEDRQASSDLKVQEVGGPVRFNHFSVQIRLTKSRYVCDMEDRRTSKERVLPI